MTFEVIKADLQRDAAQIESALRRYLNPNANKTRFEWLYNQNYHGKAMVWLAFDDQGSLVGTSAAFPRTVYFNGAKLQAWVLGDFCIDDQCRTVGPALQLQKACLAAAKEMGVAFCYDFPSASMLAVYRRLGLSPWMQMVRLAKLLKSSGKVAQFVKSRLIADVLSWPLDQLLKLYSRRDYRHTEVSFSLHEGCCGDEFSDLSERMLENHAIYIDHSSPYLNWRYLSNPLHRYEIITARRRGTLVGYCIFYQERHDATIVDLFGVTEAAIIAGLINVAEDILRNRGVTVLNVAVAEYHLFIPLLRSLCFSARDQSPIMVISSNEFDRQKYELEKANWLWMAGDRDS